MTTNATETQPTLEQVAAIMLAALKDVQDAYQEHFDIMPACWQTYDYIVEEAIDKAKEIGLR